MTRLLTILLAGVLALGAQSIRWGQIRTSETGVFNVKTGPFNAKGDGVTDDTAAIRAALVAGAGKVVYFPPGTYKVSDVGGLGYVFSLAEGTSVVGASASMQDDTTKIVSYTTNVPVFLLEADNTSVKGVYLLQSGTATSGSIGIHVKGGGRRWGEIENITAVGFYNGIYIDGTAGLFTMTNASVTNTVSHGFVGLNAQGFWTNIDAESCVGSGIYLSTGALGGGVGPWMDTVHVFANGRYGLEAINQSFVNLANFYESSSSLGGLYSNVTGTFNGVVTNFNTEWTGQNPWSGWKGVVAATNANPVEIETNVAHGWSDTDTVDCSGISGNGAANVIANAITVTGPTTFTLTGVVGTGAYTPTAGCIADPTLTGCARCSLSTATYRSHPTAPAIHLGSSNVGTTITNAHIFNPHGEGVRNEGAYTKLSNISVAGGGAGRVSAVPWSLKSTGTTAYIGMFSAGSGYIQGNDVLVEGSAFSSLSATVPALQVASGSRVKIDNNTLYNGGGGKSLQLDSGVTTIPGKNATIGAVSDSSVPDANASEISRTVTAAQMTAGKLIDGYCSDCKVTSETDNACAAGGTGAKFWYDADSGSPAWRCLKKTVAPAIVAASLTGRNTALSTADLLAAASVAAGTYRASAYIHTTTASAGACTSDVTIGWTYNSASKTKSPISSFNQAIDENFDEASVTFRAAAGAAITYAVSRSGAGCSSNVYDIYIVLERIQ